MGEEQPHLLKHLLSQNAEKVRFMSVGQICVRQVDTAKPGETVNVAALRMLQRAVGTLVVVDDAQRPIGIVTDRDLVERVVAKNRSPLDITLRDVMSTNIRTISESSTIKSAVAMMRTNKCRRLPVVDDNQRLIGLISLDDFLMLLASEFNQIGSLLERETPHSVITG